MSTAFGAFLIGLPVGYLLDPAIQSTAACRRTGVGADVLGTCPDSFRARAIPVIVAVALLCGVIGWLLANVPGTRRSAPAPASDPDPALVGLLQAVATLEPPVERSRPRPERLWAPAERD